MTTAAQKKKVHKVMHEHKEGKLKSGSGKKVRNRKQAIAIAMSESGQSRPPRQRPPHSFRTGGNRQSRPSRHPANRPTRHTGHKRR